jgi:type II secretory pathway pseudopilin PulG
MRKRIDNGFTLMELILVVAIIILLSGISLAAYFTFGERQGAQNDARNLTTMLRRVQGMATNLVYPAGCSELVGYRLYTNCSGYTEADGCKTVNVSAVCGVGGEISSIANNTVFTDAYFSGGVDVFFTAGTGEVPSPISFASLIGNMGNLVITIDANGLIDVNTL